MRLTGTLATHMDVWYRVYVSQFGWLDWASNGQDAGSTGFSRAIEGIQVVYTAKGTAAPGATDVPLRVGKVPTLSYRGHVQSIGWQPWVTDGAMAGTAGRSLRAEALQVALGASTVSGSIECRAHVQTVGWQSWVGAGQTCGTTGMSRRVEAVQLRLTEDLAKQFDLYYRVHAQTYGWLGWTSNASSSGTQGLSRRLEAVEIRIVPKGQPAPGSTTGPFVKG